MSRPTRYLLCFALFPWISVASVYADTSTGGTTSTALAESDFTISVQAKTTSGSWSELSTDDAKTFFDRARCECGTTVRLVVSVASTSVETKISNLLASSDADGEARLYLAQSSGCTSDPTESSYGCVLLDQVDALDSLVKNGYWVSAEVKISDLFASDGSCNLLKTTYVWLWIDTASDGTADLTGDSAPSLGLRLDGKGLADPTGLSVQAGKEALILSWTSLATTSTSTSDLAGYLVFCANGDGSAVFSTSPYGSQFVSPATLVNASLCPDQDALDSASLSPSLANLSPAYLCSGLIAEGQTSYRLKGLQNDVPYTLILVAVDDDGNLGTPTAAVTGTPVLTVDFYNEYANEGGEPVGGYCNVVQVAQAPRAWAFLLLLVIPIAARRRCKHWWTWVLVGFGVLASRAAFGQAILYDEGESQLDSSSYPEGKYGGSSRSVAIELHLGPYLPNVDSGLSNGATPHQNTFGTSTRLLYQLEVDYEILQGFGSFAVGVGLGYFSESAKAFVASSSGLSNGTRSADDTRLRLIPMSLLAVYRFDVLAERWQVPFVPYGKLGLSYTFWRITDGNGEIAELSEGSRGSGGTFGWQATLGLALALDGLDAVSMRELDNDSGLNHVYLFCDYSHYDASGLGMGRRLHVGDDTWSAGLLVEF